MRENNKNPLKSLQLQGKYKKSLIQFIIKTIELKTGLSISELKKKYSDERLYILGLYHVTTTNKAICEALEIPIEAGTRIKRKAEKLGKLVASKIDIICPFTKDFAKALSTNPMEFERLTLMDNNQLNLF